MNNIMGQWYASAKLVNIVQKSYAFKNENAMMALFCCSGVPKYQ